MRAPLNSSSFEQLLCLIPILLTIHNIEEVRFMEGRSRRLPMKLALTITKRQFVIAGVFFTLAGFALTYVSQPGISGKPNRLSTGSGNAGDPAWQCSYSSPYDNNPIPHV
jgi:hypothetical protein